MNISELFFSIQGESSSAGFPTVFIRCAGCNLSCTYCDTVYARKLSKGKEMALEEIMEYVEGFHVGRVAVTGGEPLLQDDFSGLCKSLLEKGNEVQIETNGSMDISVVPDGARVVMDIKTPGSGMAAQNDFSNIEKLKPGDEVKFVITSYEDYAWSCGIIEEYPRNEDIGILFSPAYGLLESRLLAEWILRDKCRRIRLQVQLHKILWPCEKGR